MSRVSVSKFTHYFLPSHTNNQRARLLHPTGLIALIIGFALLQFSLRTATVVYPEVLGYAAAQIPVSEVIRLTNIERQERGLTNLKLDPTLTEAAQKKAQDMFAKNYWAHVSPTGTQPWSFITSAGYSYRYAGENLARDFNDPSSVVKAWIASPSHRDNLLSNRYQDIGVAVVDGKLDGKETTLVVQMFGTKLSGASSRSGRVASVSVKAATNEQEETVSEPVVNLATKTKPAPVTTVFGINKTVGLTILLVFAGILFLDIFFVNARAIVRWTSKSPAHLIFILLIMAATALIARGQIV